MSEEGIMEQNFKDMKAAILCLLVAFLIASFSQSCSVTKAGHSILPSVKNYKQPPIEFKNSLKFNHPVFVNDSPKKRPTKDSIIVNSKIITPVDTTNYNKLMLENQRIGNEMTNQILRLLLNKEKENKNLKVENKILAKKSVLTEDQRQDSISMRAIWEVASYILSLIGFGIILLMIWTYFTVRFFNKKVRAPLSNCSDGRK